MLIAKVTGVVVASQKNKHLEGNRLLIVQPLGKDLKPEGHSLLATDQGYAGFGETVLIIDEGTSARQVFGNPEIPVRTFVAGVIDRVDLE
jgi:microcompartment protein CcmK/EutM